MSTNNEIITKDFSDNVIHFIKTSVPTLVEIPGHGSRCIVQGTQADFDRLAKMIDCCIARSSGTWKRSLRAARGRFWSSAQWQQYEQDFAERKAAKAARKASKLA